MFFRNGVISKLRHQCGWKTTNSMIKKEIPCSQKRRCRYFLLPIDQLGNLVCCWKEHQDILVTCQDWKLFHSCCKFCQSRLCHTWRQGLWYKVKSIKVVNYIVMISEVEVIHKCVGRTCFSSAIIIIIIIKIIIIIIINIIIIIIIIIIILSSSLSPQSINTLYIYMTKSKHVNTYYSQLFPLIRSSTSGSPTWSNISFCDVSSEKTFPNVHSIYKQNLHIKSP